MVDSWKDEHHVWLSVIRVPSIDVVSVRDKFVFVTYIGTDVPHTEKARVVFQGQAARELLQGAQVFPYEVPDRETFSQISLAELLSENCGNDRPEKYRFGPSDVVHVVQDKLIHDTSGENQDDEKQEAAGGASRGAPKKLIDSVRDEGRMNTSGEAISEAWARVREEVDGSNFLVIGISPGSRDTVELVGSGDGGFKAMRKLFDTKRILFSVLRVPAIDVVGHRNRFVFITYIGDNVAPAQKARVVFQKSATEKLLTGISQFLNYEISDNASFSQMDIAEAVDRAMGAGDRPDRYELGPGDFVDVKGDKLVPSTEEGPLSASTSRSTSPTRKHGRAKRRNNLEVSIDKQCLSAWEALLEGKENYFVMGYEEGSNSHIVLTDRGEGGFEALRANLSPDLVQFAFLSVPAIDVKRAFPKVLFIVWTGANVSMMRKARLTPQIDVIRNNFKGHVIYMLQASEPSQITQVSIAEFLLEMGDKPDKYQFGPNDFVRIVEDQLIHETGDGTVAAAPAAVPRTSEPSAKSKADLKGAGAAATTETKALTKSFQLKALKEEQLKLKSEKSSLESRLRQVDRRLQEISQKLKASA